MYLRQASALAARRATAGSVRRLATGKDVKFGVEGRALMLQGVDMLADAVQVRELKNSRVAACGVRVKLPSRSPSLSVGVVILPDWPDPVF